MDPFRESYNDIMSAFMNPSASDSEDMRTGSFIGSLGGRPTGLGGNSPAKDGSSLIFTYEYKTRKA